MASGSVGRPGLFHGVSCLSCGYFSEYSTVILEPLCLWICSVFFCYQSFGWNSTNSIIAYKSFLSCLGDAVLTTCYLINHMPSSILQNQIPHSILYPMKSLCKLSPHIFGSTCFIHDLKLGKDKLSTQSIKCVFCGLLKVTEMVQALFSKSK